MVTKGGGRQSSANAGELDQALAGRVDIKPYYSGGLAYHNIEPVPQGGFRQMAGSRDLGPVRGRIEPITQSGVSTAPGPHSNTTVSIWTAVIDQPVAAIHIAGIAASAGTHSAVVQALAGGAWVTIGSAFSIGVLAKTRTFARIPGTALMAEQIRVLATVAGTATFSIGSVAALTELPQQDPPRYASLRHDSGDRYSLSLQPRFLDIFLDDSFAAGVWLPTMTADRYAQVGFYAENATIGLFHHSIAPQRITRAGAAHDWTVDAWPLEGIPTVDLGGIYPKLVDRWEIFLRWVEDTSDNLYITLQVDGEKTATVVLKDSGGAPVAIDGAPDWSQFAADLAAALTDLPSLGPGVFVSATDMAGNAHRIDIAFGGALAGREFQLDPIITNTADIAALAVHTAVGKTEYEPLLSAGRGWPGVVGLVQDRLGYGDILAEPSALLHSQAAEYFSLNIEAAGASAARLDRLRAGQTAERILAIMDATYLLVFTDQAVHFAANRSITSTEPLNFTITSEAGIVPNTEPVNLEGKIFYVARNDDDEGDDGSQALSMAYDEIQARFDATPESILASHLVKRVIRTKRQKSGSDTDASRMWMLRQDGLLVCAQIIRSQEIIGMCRWYAAAGGLVREIQVDGKNRLRVCVERGQLRHERLDPAIFLHAAVTAAAETDGTVTGLALHAGRQVWAVAQGYVLGPFTVSGAGAINLGGYYSGPVLVGLWQCPRWESMPRWHIRPNDEIVKRPGRIHTVHANVIDTTSIAIGANGQPAREVPLARLGDPANAPTPAATRKLTVGGLMGAKDGTTLVVTQSRPGALRIRELVIEEKL